MTVRTLKNKRFWICTISKVIWRNHRKKGGPRCDIPVKAARLDGVGHFPGTGDRRQRCEHPLCTAKSKTFCIKCEVFLCFVSKDCLLNFQATFIDFEQVLRNRKIAKIKTWNSKSKTEPNGSMGPKRDKLPQDSGFRFKSEPKNVSDYFWFQKILRTT